MHHLICGNNSFLHSVDLILVFTLLLVHLILHTSYHIAVISHLLSPSHPWPFTPDLKLISFTNPVRHDLSGSIWTAFTDLKPVPDKVDTLICLF